MRTMEGWLAKLAKVARPRLAEVSSWAVVSRKVGAASRPRHWPGRWITRSVAFSNLSVVFPSLNFFPPLQTCVF